MVDMQGYEAFLEELRWLGVRVLVTSRSQLGGRVLCADQIHLGGLPAQHAAELVRQQAGPRRVTPSQAQELASVCDCNALSLKVVGGLIVRQAVAAQVHKRLPVCIPRMRLHCRSSCELQ